MFRVISVLLHRYTIRPYCDKMDEQSICKIALQHIEQLTSIPYGCDSLEGRAQYLQNQITIALRDKTVYKDVVVIEGKVVGFHNYRIYQSWHGTYGHMMQLAIDKEFQKGGLGSVLFKYALHRCKEEGAHAVIFEITCRELVAYYKKLGCKVICHPGGVYDPDSGFIPAGTMGTCLKSSGRCVDYFRLRHKQIFPAGISLFGVILWVGTVLLGSELLKYSL